LDTSDKKTTSKKSIALIIGAIALLLIAGSLSAYFLYILPQQKADLLALEQRKVDIAEKEKEDNLALEREKHEAAVEAEKEKTSKDFEIKQAELNRELEADCQNKIANLQLKANNIENGKYNPLTGNCEVTFTSDGVTQTAPIQNMVKSPPSNIEVFVLEDDGSTPITHSTYNIRFKEPVEFKGNISSNCDEIIVTATNPNFKAPDKVTLQKYHAGDPTFVYHAKKALNNLGTGITEYKFTALCEGKNISTTVSVYLEGPGYTLSYTPKKYDKNVEDLQTRLNEQGADIVVDGYFGEQTRTAVMNYQKEQGLTVDGIVGPVTWSALEGNPDY